MRKFVLLLIILITSSIYSQDNQVKIDPMLEPFVVEFTEEAINRGIDAMPDLFKLDYIIVSTNTPQYLGLYNKPRKTVFINYFVLNDYMMARTVIFHELFHALYEMEHCHGEGLDLMCESKPRGFTFAYYHNDEVWQNELEKSFDRAKELIELREIKED